MTARPSPLDPQTFSGILTDLAGKQPLDSDLTSIAGLSTTSFGRALLVLANAAALLSAAGGAAASHSHAESDVTSLVSDLALKAPLASPTFTGTVVLPSGQALIAPALGTPASGVATNLTGTAAGLTAGTVTTNANLTGDVTSSGNATTIGAAKVTDAMRVNRAAISVWGRSANSIGVGADIAAAANGQFLSRVASVVGFNGLDTATPVNTLALTKLANASATAHLIGRITALGGAWEDITMANLVTMMGGKQTVTGSRGGNAALASALTGLATLGLITDSSTA